jgi:hypothetical protein
VYAHAARRETGAEEEPVRHSPNRLLPQRASRAPVIPPACTIKSRRLASSAFGLCSQYDSQPWDPPVLFIGPWRRDGFPYFLLSLQCLVTMCKSYQQSSWLTLSLVDLDRWAYGPLSAATAFFAPTAKYDTSALHICIGKARALPGKFSLRFPYASKKKKKKKTPRI